MPLADLRAKYGKARDTRSLVNRAIRAEVVGGDDALDAATKLHRLTYRLRDRNLRGVDHAQAALASVEQVLSGMTDVIYERYRIGENYHQS